MKVLQESAFPEIADSLFQEPYHHRVGLILDDGTDTVVFKWHWPRGTFDKRMSALELAAFILPHMPSITGLLSDHPRIKAEFYCLLLRLVTNPKDVLDEVVPWIKSVIRTEEDDIIELDIGGKTVTPGPVCFVGSFAPCPLQ